MRILLAYARKTASEDVSQMRVLPLERSGSERDPLQVLRTRLESRFALRPLSGLRTHDIRGSRSIHAPLQPLRPRMASPHRGQTGTVSAVQEHEVGFSASGPLRMPFLRKDLDRRRRTSAPLPLMQEHDVESSDHPRPMQGMRPSMGAQGRTQHGGRFQLSEVQIDPLDGAAHHREMRRMRHQLYRTSGGKRLPRV